MRAVEEETQEAVQEAEAKDVVLVLEKNTKQPVLSVARNVLFRLSLQKENRFFAENVLQKEEEIVINDSLSE
jgi:hypothetical protein